MTGLGFWLAPKKGLAITRTKLAILKWKAGKATLGIRAIILITWSVGWMVGRMDGRSDG